MVYTMRFIQLLLAALLLGCSGQYHRELWNPPTNLAKATADWDVASATCDAEALATKLSEEEKAHLYSDLENIDQEEYRGENTNEKFDKTIVALNASVMFLNMYKISTAEENKRGQVFVACMKRLGWQRR